MVGSGAMFVGVLREVREWKPNLPSSGTSPVGQLEPLSKSGRLLSMTNIVPMQTKEPSVLLVCSL